MTYIITALLIEAKPIINHFKLKKEMIDDLIVYKNSDITLCITQVGYDNALHVSRRFLYLSKPTKDDIVINIGVCAAPTEYKIGEVLLIDRVEFEEKSVTLHVTTDISLTTLKEPQSSYLNTPVDMEAYAIYEAGRNFFEFNQIFFIKIVSDHFEPKSLNKNLLYALINRNINNISSLIKEFLICQQQ